MSSPPPSSIRLAAPHPALRAYVKAYVGMEQWADETSAVSAIPDPVLMVSWGGAVRPLTGAPGGPLIPFLALAGPLSRGHRVGVEAGATGFHVRFTPTGARALLGERAVADAWTEGLPAAVERWAEAVAEAPSFGARVALADGLWLSRLPGAGAWSDPAVGLITRAAGAQSVGSLADALGVSARTLRRRFFDDVGLGVKTFAQVERYRQAHGHLLRTPGATWRDACERYGYADQAHFVRAFRRFTGEPPTRWRPDGHRIDLGMGLREEGV